MGVRAAQQTNKQMTAEKNLFNSTLGCSKTCYNIFDRKNEKAKIVQRKTQKHTRQREVFNLFYRFIGRNVWMFPEITSDNRLKSAICEIRNGEWEWGTGNEESLKAEIFKTGNL